MHKRDSQIAVLDEDGDIVTEQRIQNTAVDSLAKSYAGSKAAMEATGNYFAIYDSLAEHLEVEVADPGQTKAIGTAEAKNDRLDAKFLAQLCRAGMIAQSYVPPEDIRQRRALVRARKRLMDKRTDFKNQVHAVLDREGVVYEWDPYSVAGRERLATETRLVSDVSRTVVESLLRAIDTLTEEINRLEREIERAAASLADTQLLMTIPG